MSDTEPDRRILASSTLTRNYQVTIPKPVRERFRFEEGDLVVFILEEGRLLIERG